MDQCLTDSTAPPTEPIEDVRRLYLEHAPALHQYAARRVGRDQASDVVAETFRRAIEFADRFDERLGSRRAWLFGIATNIMRRHVRSEQRRVLALGRYGRHVEHDADPLVVTVPQIDAERRLTHVLRAVAELSIEDYELLLLVAWEEMSITDAAAVVGIPAGTARSRLHRIRQHLDHESET
jgi:RNA polymerase sigma-70 factor (ECF subfamily)